MEARGRGPRLEHCSWQGRLGGGGREMNEDECHPPFPPFYKSVGQLKSPEAQEPPKTNFATLAKFLPKLNPSADIK